MRENGGKNESYRMYIKCWKYSRKCKLLGNELNHLEYSFKQAKNMVSCGSEIIYLGWVMAKEIKEYIILPAIIIGLGLILYGKFKYNKGIF